MKMDALQMYWQSVKYTSSAAENTHKKESYYNSTLFLSIFIEQILKIRQATKATVLICLHFVEEILLLKLIFGLRILPNAEDNEKYKIKKYRCIRRAFNANFRSAETPRLTRDFVGKSLNQF